jgi:hypothetical protein
MKKYNYLIYIIITILIVLIGTYYLSNNTTSDYDEPEINNNDNNYINELKIIDVKKISDDTSSIIQVSNNMIHSNVVINSPTSVVTFVVTVYNDTDYDYSYVNTTFNQNYKEFYDNLDIVYGVHLDKGTIIKSGEIISFNLIFKFRDQNKNHVNNLLESYLNLNFKKIERNKVS